VAWNQMFTSWKLDVVSAKHKIKIKERCLNFRNGWGITQSEDWVVFGRFNNPYRMWRLMPVSHFQIFGIWISTKMATFFKGCTKPHVIAIICQESRVGIQQNPGACNITLTLKVCYRLNACSVDLGRINIGNMLIWYHHTMVNHCIEFN
jgi:hypothetical protein